MASALIQPSRLVGRDSELSQLGEALSRALSGSGSVVCVRGEAGVGKTRLLLEMAGRCRERGISVHRAECPPGGRTTALLPWLELMRSFFGVSELEDEHDLRREVAGELALADPSFHGDLPLVFDLLGVSDPERPSPQIDAAERRERLGTFLPRLLRARGARGPSLLVIDDADAIDPMSEALLRVAAGAVPETPTLLLLSCGHARRLPWLDAAGACRMELLPLSSHSTRELIVELLGSDPSTTGLAARIAAASGGSPWLARESVRWLAETGPIEGEPGDYRCAEDPGATAIPDDARSLLSDRFGRLSEGARSVLDVACVAGARIARPILVQVLGVPEPEIDAALEALCRAGILYPSAAEHRFEHPLHQEVAYTSLDPARRAKLHADVALAIEETFFERLDSLAGLLAHHWAAAGQSASAERWWMHAARRAGFEDQPPQL